MTNTDTYTHSPIFSTENGTYYCSTCGADMTYEEALAINPDIN